MLSSLSAMAEVRRQLGNGIYKLSHLTVRQLKPSEQFDGTYCAFLTVTEKLPRCTSLIITRAFSSGNHDTITPLHRSKTAYYDILQVLPNATQSQIKTAYYKQSFLYHPDKNADRHEATCRFVQISEAYSVLGDTGLRKKYDRGTLSPSDVQRAEKPRSPGERAETPLRSWSTPQPPRARSFGSTTVGGKPIFDFDAFYQAHYGEQLQKHQALRRKQLHKKQRDDFRKWKLAKMREATVGALVALGVGILVSMRC